MTYKEFAAKHGLSLDLAPLAARSDSEFCASDLSPEPVHFEFVLRDSKGRVIYSGEYSQGVGIAEHWARRNKTQFVRFPRTLELLKQPHSWRKPIRCDAQYWADIRHVYTRAVLKDSRQGGDEILPAWELFESLCLDAMGSDVCFSNWACDLGYSSDTIKARRVWETCNEIRRALNGAFGYTWEGLSE